MSMITKPIILDETGRQIASILEGIRDAISAKSVDVPNMPGVKFIDYDGTVVYFAGRDEILHMKKLPDAPVHVNLTAQGWNWSLADIKAYMTKYPDAVMTVGQMYIHSDGKTHMVLDVGPRLTIPLMIQQTVSEGVTINWGDGSEKETIEGTGTVTTSHTYASEGEYEITLDVADGCTLDFGGTVNNTNYNAFGDSNAGNFISSLTKLFIGNGVISVGSESFRGCYNLMILTIPNNVISIETRAFDSCHSILNLIIPNAITSITLQSFYECLSLKNLSMPNTVTSIDDYSFALCTSLTTISIPDNVTIIKQLAFTNCYALTNLTIPDNVSFIAIRAFRYCYNLNILRISESLEIISQDVFSTCLLLTNLTLPNSVSTINSGAFVNCYNLYSLTILAETPPTLANVNAFNNMPTDCTIYVPNGKGDAYKAASGWSTWASQIQELPE